MILIKVNNKTPITKDVKTKVLLNILLTSKLELETAKPLT